MKSAACLIWALIFGVAVSPTLTAELEADRAIRQFDEALFTQLERDTDQGNIDKWDGPVQAVAFGDVPKRIFEISRSRTQFVSSGTPLQINLSPYDPISEEKIAWAILCLY